MVGPSETFELLRVLVSAGLVTAVVVQAGQVLVEWMRGRNRIAEIQAEQARDVAKIGATSEAKIAEMWASFALQLAMERERLDRPFGELDRPKVEST